MKNEKGYLMKFTVNQHHDTSVSLMTDMGYVLGYFTSIDEAIDTCRSEEHTSELQSPMYLVCRLLLEKNNSYLVHP